MLGEVYTNWKHQLMRFVWNDKWVELQGDPSLGVTQTSLRAMERILRKEKYGVLVELCQLQTKTDAPPNEPPSFLQPVLEKFQYLYTEPKSLPPTRPRDHAIVLKDGTNPISVRP